MGRIGLLAFAGTVLALAGCSSGVMETSEAAQPAPFLVAGSPLSLALNAWQGSGESGAVTFTPLTAEETQVQVQLTGTAGPHQGFLHVGSCASMGAVVAKLGALDVDANGTGTLTRNVDLPLSLLRDGNHFIAFHEANGDPGNAVACTDIPGIQ